MLENSEIKSEKKQFKRFWLTFQNIIETKPITIKGMYPVK